MRSNRLTRTVRVLPCALRAWPRPALAQTSCARRPTAAPPPDAPALYQQHCAACHGAPAHRRHGPGPAARKPGARAPAEVLRVIGQAAPPRK